ncbi:DUF3575 domain-containing protein [Neolewinella aurantiaca]|nr:DUF3575 domain-containing protein [Neolewinella aurantiaca]
MNFFKNLLCTCALALLSLTASAQIDAKLNGGSLVTGGINIVADFAINYNSSLAIGIGRANTKLTVNENQYQYLRYRIIPEYRHYFDPQNGADGLFAGAYGRLAFFEGEAVSEGENVSGTRLALGAMFGNKWAYDSGFVLELNAGAGYGTAFGNKESAQVTTAFYQALPGLDLRLGVLVGYRFNR